MLDRIWRLDALAAQPAVHLLLGHLPADQAAIEIHELVVVRE